MYKMMPTHPVTAMLFRQKYQVPTDYEPDEDMRFPIEVGREKLSGEAVKDIPGERIISAFLSRSGSDPDDLPDFMWFPWTKSVKDCAAACGSILWKLKEMRLLDIILPVDLPAASFRSTEQLLDEANLAMALDGHVYVVCRDEVGSAMYRSVEEVARDFRISLPSPLPPLSTDESVSRLFLDGSS
ncbi:MAG: hypothetical protein ACT4OM_12855 [Actinomycetota bacterium]